MATTLTELDPTIRTGTEQQSVKPGSCATYLFAETAGSSGAAVADAATARGLGGSLDQLILSTMQSHGGRVIRTIGSSVILEFDSPITAVRGAVELHRRGAAIPEEPNSQPYGLRVGIYSLGDPGSGIEMFSTMVNGVVSITKKAAFGQILISSEAHQRVSKQSTLQFSRLPVNQTGGGAENEEVFEVAWRETAGLNIPSRYEVLSEVGKGGMGIVHKVRDRETGEIIALKILRPEVAEDPAMQENLRREVCLARKVTHKNVCRIHEFNRSNGAVFISMEFVEGESLHSMLHRVGPFSWADAANTALQICAGLREAHLQGIVHRDLKPTNIMVDATGGVKVMDFGIARQFQGTGQLTNTMVGTPAYMAPEQLEMKRVDARADIYALGVLLYEMVTGEQPFTGETPIAVALKHLREQPTRPREIMATLPAHAEEIILKCLRKDSAKRFQTVDELIVALRRDAARKPAISQWDVFIADFRGAGQDLKRAIQPHFEKAEQYLRSRDWRGLAKLPAKPAIGAAIGATALLAALVVFSVVGSRKSHATGPSVIASATAAVNPQGGSTSSFGPDFHVQAGNGAGASATHMITSSPVNLGITSGVAAKNDLANSWTKTDAALKSSVPAPESKVIVTKHRLKPQPIAHDAALPLPMQRPQPAPVTSIATAAPADAAKPAVADEGSEPAGFASASTLLGVATDAKASDADTGLSAAKALYLEVGTFKDSTWADNAVEKLRQLGLHSISYRKNVLWMQSYQVRVGPYANQKDLEEARQKLVVEGFKPHPVK